jgi:hypothetical protein
LETNPAESTTSFPDEVSTTHTSFVDVTTIAYDYQFPFKTYVSRDLLRNYTVAGVPDDDEGRLFVEGIVDDILAAITGRIPGTSIGYGTSFAIQFQFLAQHRRRPMPEVLKLRALFGPWDSDPEVYVSRVLEPGSSGHAADESPAF